jgi:hypothetical protein
MSGPQNSEKHEQVSTGEEQTKQTGIPFKKIVYVGDLSGEPSYGLRYTQQLVHERHAEVVLVHSLDPVVYALPGAKLPDGDAQAELTAMEHDPKRRDANHDSLVQREQICKEILAEAHDSHQQNPFYPEPRKRRAHVHNTSHHSLRDLVALFPHGLVARICASPNPLLADPGADHGLLCAVDARHQDLAAARKWI